VFDLTPKERVQKARIRLLREHPFFGYCLMQIPVVATDEKRPRGPRIVYNPGFVEKLNDDELMAVLAHELLHYLLGHGIRTRAFKKKMMSSMSEEEKRGFRFRMNVAEDVVINAILTLNGFKLPQRKFVSAGETVEVRQGAVVPDVFNENGKVRTVVTLVDAEGRRFTIEDPHTKSCEEVFLEIRDFVAEDQQQQSEPDTMQFEDDSEEMGRDAGEEKRNGESKQEEKGGAGEGEKDREAADTEDREADGTGDMAGTDTMTKTPEELISEAYNYSKLAGKEPLGLDRIIGDLPKPKLNLIPFLRQFVTKAIPSDYTYLRPAKNSPPDVFHPSVEMGERIEGIVAIDTSGSMSPEEIAQSVSEIVKLAKSMSIKLTIVQCDAEVQVVKEVESVKEILKMPVKGGGGTDFRPVFELAEKRRVRFVVFFTDGYGTFLEKCRIPTLWILTPEGIAETSVPFGKAIKML